MSDEKVQLSERAELNAAVLARLAHMARTGEEVTMEQVAALITDDILASEWMVRVINRSTKNGIDAGYEKGLRDSIAAVGEIERTGAWEGGPFNLVPYDEAQRYIARLSKRGLESLWEETAQS